MTHNQIDESFCSYLGTNLLLHPTITSFLKYSKISYYNYKKNYENDLEFLDEISIFIFKKRFISSLAMYLEIYRLREGALLRWFLPIVLILYR